MKRIIFLLIILTIIVYFQYNFIHDNNNSYEILQYENPNKDIFENIIHEKLISVFTNIVFDISNNNKIKHYTYYDFKMDIMKKNKQKLTPIIKHNLSFYNIPLHIYNTTHITYEINDSKIPLTIQNKFRYLIYQIEGVRRFYIFAPDNRQNLYFKKNRTPIDFWDQNIELYPLLNKTKYLEIILTEGQMLSIPMNWIYASVVEEYSYTIFYSSDSIFSYFLK